MRGYRPQRNRRRVDPVGIAVPPAACLLLAAHSGAPDGNTVSLVFNSSVSLELTDFDGWFFGGEEATAITRSGPNSYDITLGADIAPDSTLIKQPIRDSAFGPNILYVGAAVNLIQ